MDAKTEIWLFILINAILTICLYTCLTINDIHNILIEESNKEVAECSSSSTGEFPENRNILDEENEILYTFIENIDTYKSIEDAVKASEDVIEQIQFLYE